MEIRPACPGDAGAIARVHVESWRTTYKGIMPDEVLDGLSVERRRDFWAKVLQEPSVRSFVYVAVDDAGQVVGFASGGPEHSGDPVHDGEVYAIYLLKEQQARGIGRQLMAAAAKRLLADGCTGMLVWVAAENPSRRFYEALGGIRLAEKTEQFAGTTLTEIAYGWQDLTAFQSERRLTMESIRIAYGPGEWQFGDLRLPPGPGPHPVALIIHGGFWRARYGLDLMDRMAEDFASRGIAAWNIEYRRVGHAGGGWPGTLTDVALAADYLRELTPVHRLDLDRVVAIGHSAGGHLALWLAGRHRLPAGGLLATAQPPLRLRGAISLAGVCDLAQMWRIRHDGPEDNPVDALMEGGPAQRPERYAQASPSRLLPLGVPQVLVHGTEDPVVPIAVSERYCEAARAAGDPVELIALPGVEHFAVIDPASAAWPPIAGAMERLAEG